MRCRVQLCRWFVMACLVALLGRVELAAQDETAPPPDAEMVAPETFGSGEFGYSEAPVVGHAGGPMCDGFCGIWGIGSPWGTWIGRASGVFMQRGTPDDVPLIESAGGATLIDAGEIDFDYEPGFDVSVVHVNHQNGVEWRFLWLEEYDGASSARIVDPVIATNPVTPLFGNLGVAIDYTTQMRSVELNHLQMSQGPFTLIAGFRFVDLDEELSIDTSDIFGAQTSTMFLVDNDLFGFQMGVGATLLHPTCRFRVEGIAKGGVYYNDVVSQVALRTNFDFDRTGAFDTDRPAFVGEFRLTGTYQFNHGLALRAGWQLLWLEGVTLASEQVPSTGNVTDVPILVGHNDGGVLFQGGFAGLEYRF